MEQLQLLVDLGLKTVSSIPHFVFRPDLLEWKMTMSSPVSSPRWSANEQAQLWPCRKAAVNIDNGLPIQRSSYSVDVLFEGLFFKFRKFL